MAKRIKDYLLTITAALATTKSAKTEKIVGPSLDVIQGWDEKVTQASEILDEVKKSVDQWIDDNQVGNEISQKLASAIALAKDTIRGALVD